MHRRFSCKGQGKNEQTRRECPKAAGHEIQRCGHALRRLHRAVEKTGTAAGSTAGITWVPEGRPVKDGGASSQRHPEVHLLRRDTKQL